MKDMKYETGYFAKQKDRDSVIILIFAVIIGYIIYMWWVYQQTAKSPLDNRPRPF